MFPPWILHSNPKVWSLFKGQTWDDQIELPGTLQATKLLSRAQDLWNMCQVIYLGDTEFKPGNASLTMVTPIDNNNQKNDKIRCMFSL